jgi:hydroxymethylglutaryl-CoA reductase
MCILSNYTPECLVQVLLECPVSRLVSGHPEITSEAFAGKFKRALSIAEGDVFRAVTHNKGILNGVDAVVIATGNDFRAVESGVHAWAARTGSYRSLSRVELSDGIFRCELTLPLALGTVGGLTSVHPLASLSLQLLKNPSAGKLMQIAACAGLASNFAAVRSLVTSGIQQGHMKMHLTNIMNSLGATTEEKEQLRAAFTERTVSYSEVKQSLDSLRLRRG